MNAQRNHDAVLDDNLRTIGRRVTFPEEATEDQQARWKAMAHGASARHGSNPLRLLARIPPHLRLAAGLAVASALGILGWIGFDGGLVASAATIFQGFRNALGQPVWIDVDGVDLGTAIVSGQLFLDVGGDPTGTADDVLFSELHVRLLADDSRWADIDAVAVACQAPGQAWAYTRGNGIGGPVTEGPGGTLVPTVPDDFIVDRAWTDFAENPLGQFGGIPLRMSLSMGGDQVTYRFGALQRAYVASLMGWLLAFTGESGAETLVADLERLAEAVRIDKDVDGYWVLKARGPFGPGPADSGETATFDFEAQISAETGRVMGSATRNVVSAGGDLSPHLRDAMTDLTTKLFEPRTADALAELLRDRADAIEIDKSDPQTWILRATGISVSASSQNANLTLAELTLHYDPEAGLVRVAEFTNVGSRGGVIRIELGGGGIDPAILDPQRWVGGGAGSNR